MADELQDNEPVIPPGWQTIGGHYNLTRKLGEGAFGVVYEAHHELLDQEFAVKVLKPEMCADENTRERFLDEARALIRFSHPNVVQLRHVGEHAGQLYLVMDLIRGKPLDEILLTSGAFPERRAVAIVLQILAGLEAAHGAGIVHRDLKPSNLVLEKRPDGVDYVRILDFGLSKLSSVDGAKSQHRSVTGSIIGTLAYMSPEQLSGEADIDARADLFATGLILQELLEGHHPYPGESGIVVAAKLLRDSVPQLGEGIEVSDATRAALATALQRDRDARYLSATAFAQALEGKGPPSDTSRVTTIEHARQELARQEAEAAAAEKAAARAARTDERKSKTPLVIGVVVVVLLLVGGSLFLLGPGDDAGGGTSVATGGNGGGTLPDTPEPGPGTPLDPAPNTPEDPGPDTPADPAPNTPVDPGPDTPLDPAPDTPVDPGPDTPLDPAPDTPVDPGPDTPLDPAPDTPGDPGPDTPLDPAPDTPEDPAPDTPEPGASLPATPLECCEAAEAAAAKGDWAKARELFAAALDKEFAADPSAMKLTETYTRGLRGVAESYITEADRMARAGKVDEALARYAEAIDWTGGEYKRHADEKVAMDTRQLQLGYTRLYAGQSHLERARWVKTRGEDSAAETQMAQDDFEFAGQSLLKEGLDDAEYRMRRAELRRFLGRTAEQLADLEWITQEANESVIYPYMWVAHARANRQLAELGLWKSGDRSAESTHAEAAWQIARKGASYREKELSKRDWLEFCRVAWIRGMYQRDGQQMAQIASMLRWWLTLAKQAPALAFESEALSTAREDVGDAMQAYAEARAAQIQKQPEVARAKYEAAIDAAKRAIAKRDEVAANGERLQTSLPYRILGFALMSLDMTDEAQPAFENGRKADAVNPD